MSTTTRGSDIGFEGRVSPPEARRSWWRSAPVGPWEPPMDGRTPSRARGRLGPALLLVLGIAVELPHARAQGTVRILDDDGPADFSTLQAALSGSGTGDILLVKPGTYPGVPDPAFPSFFQAAELVGKSLTVIAETPGTAVLRDGVRVADLVPGQLAVLRGFDFGTNGSLGVLVQNCQGVAWIEDCRFPASVPVPSFPPPRVAVESSGAVHLLRCDIRGTDSFEGLAPGPAMSASGSQVALYDCDLEAGGGFSVLFSGEPALRQTGGLVFASGSGFQGGDSTGPFPSSCPGPGISVAGVGAELWTLDCTIAAGNPGLFACTPPPAVQTQLGATWSPLAGSARGFQVGSPAREGFSTTLDFEGEAGDAIWLQVGLAGGFFFDPFLHAVFELELLPVLSLPQGTLGPGGQLSLQLGIGTLGTGVGGALVLLQPSHLTAGPELFLGGGSALVILDANVP